LPHFSKSNREKSSIDSTSSLSPSGPKPSFRSVSSSAPSLPSSKTEMPNGLVCGPALSPYRELKLSRISSKRFNGPIQWYRSPRGKGHLRGSKSKCERSCDSGAVEAFWMNSENAGDYRSPPCQLRMTDIASAKTLPLKHHV
jgi:hypothetical protein